MYFSLVSQTVGNLTTIIYSVFTKSKRFNNNYLFILLTFLKFFTFTLRDKITKSNFRFYSLKARAHFNLSRQYDNAPYDASFIYSISL